MIVYSGPIEDTGELILFFRRQESNLRALRKLIVSPQKTVIRDVNGDGVEFPGVTYGSAALEALCREVGVVFTPATLHNPNATPDGVKEFVLSARHPWGHDRIL